MNESLMPRLAAAVLFLALLSCARENSAPASVNSRVADEAAVNEAAQAREHAVAARDVDRILTFYEPDGWQMAVGGEIAKTEAARRQFWEGVAALPIAQLVVDVDSNTVVSSAGDIAARYGTFRQVVLDKQGNPTSVPQKNMSLWRKQPDGSWKIVASIVSATAPDQ